MDRCLKDLCLVHLAIGGDAETARMTHVVPVFH